MKFFKSYKLLLTCLATLAITFLQAQEKKNTIIITGIVKDSVADIPIPFATISITTDQGQAALAMVCKEDGSFSHPIKRMILPARLQITAIGFNEKHILLKQNTNGSIDLKNIFLLPGNTTLKAVQVTARVPLIKQQPDRLEYNLQADPDSKSKNLLEMMKKMPYLSVDANENVLFRGSGNFKIFINGKPSGLMDNNSKEALKSIPANTIQRVEIITNPSSRYDAEGVAGIINIITSKKRINGYSGSLNINHRFPAGGPGMGSSFALKAGKLGLSAFGGYYRSKNPLTSFSNSQQTVNTDLSQDGSRHSKYSGGYLGIDMSYETDSLHLFTLQMNGNTSTNKSNDNQSTLIKTGNNISENYTLQNEGSSTGKGSDLSFNYQIGFKHDKKKLLTFSYRYARYGNDLFNQVGITTLNSPGSSGFIQANTNSNREHTLQADWVQNIGMIKLETGIKGIFRKNISDYDSTTTQLNNNEFVNTQNIGGIYASAGFVLKGWNIQTGARLESTFTDINFSSTQTRVRQQYFNLIPNISINKTFQQQSISFGFSQRIKRPGVNRLNPFVNRSNPNFEISGNPYLKAVVNNDLMVNYSYNKKIFLNLGLAYSFSNKIDLKVIVFDTATHITSTTYENSSKAKRLGLDYNLTYPITNKINLAVNGNIAQFFIEGFSDGRLQHNDMSTYSFTLSAGWQLGKQWQLNGSLDVNSKNPAGLQNYTNGFTGSSLSISKTFLNNKLSISSFVNNPFTKYRNISTTTVGANFSYLSLSKEYFRVFGVSISYKFGSGKESVKNTRRNIKNNHVAIK